MRISEYSDNYRSLCGREKTYKCGVISSHRCCSSRLRSGCVMLNDMPPHIFRRSQLRNVCGQCCATSQHRSRCCAVWSYTLSPCRRTICQISVKCHPPSWRVMLRVNASAMRIDQRFARALDAISRRQRRRRRRRNACYL